MTRGYLSTVQAADWWAEHSVATQAIGVAALLLACLIVVWVFRSLRPALTALIRRSRIQWDDALLDANLFRWLSYLAAAAAGYFCVTFIPQLSPRLENWAKNFAQAVMVFGAMMAIGALLTTFNALYARRPEARSRPIKGYIQIVKIFLYVVGSIFIVALLFDSDPWGFFAGLGAMTAVLLLIFKDTILSLVASVQLTSNDMVRVGDWIEIPSMGVDGDVTDVALHTVTVQNFDKTISTVPTYKLISDTFRNWRGMSESGGRRIKRSLHLDVASVRFLTDDEIERLGRWELLADYVDGKRNELAEWNANRSTPAPRVAAQRHLTNIGTFRAYVVAYLRHHAAIHGSMTLLVRQLQPTADGLPLEIYAFTNTTAWGEYEAIQADIFDHLLAILPEFGLRAYQHPAGSDLAILARGVTADKPG